MAQAHKGSPAREVIEGRPNEVISAAEARVMMFRFTDTNGYVDIGLALCFGKDKEDGGLGVYAVSTEKLKEALTIPHAHVKAGIRQYLEAADKPTELSSPELPEFEDPNG